MSNQGPLSGQKLANEKYLLAEMLGSGGMGAVYHARDTRLNRSVAVKVMSPASPVSPAELQHFTQLFQAEALRLASLKHPGIPHIYDHFEESGYWFLVMEFIEGQTLKDTLDQRGGRLPVDEVLRIGLQLAGVLEYLHQRQPPIIFRDLKPANVMIAPDEQVYLIDFGIARLFTPGKSQDTFVFLSRGYAAPEQHGTAQTTVRSDIYSLGATLHHLLSGTHPASSPFLFAPLPIQQPAQLAPLIAQMVALDAAHRPTSMAEVKEVLQHMRNQAAASTSTGAVSPSLVHPVFFAPTQPSPLAAPTTPAVNPPIGTAWAQVGTPTALGSPSGSPVQSVASSPPAAMGALPRGTTLVIHKSSKGQALAWSPDGQQIASSSLGGMEVWDASTGKTLSKSFPELDTKVPIVWSPNGKYIVGCRLSEVRIWEWNARRVDERKARRSFWRRELEPVEPERPVGGILFSSSRGYYSFSYDGTNCRFPLILWAPDSLKVAVVDTNNSSLPLGEVLAVSTLRGSDPIVQRSVPEKHCNGDAVAWSPDSTRIAWGTRYEVPVWDVSSSEQEGHHRLTYREHRSPIVGVSWSPDGRQIKSWCEDGSGHIWDVGSGQTLGTFTVPAEGRRDGGSSSWLLKKMAKMIKERREISPDGALKAVSTGDGVELRTVARDEVVFVYRDYLPPDKTAEHWSPYAHSMVWSPDGTRIALRRFDETIYIWQAV